MAEALGPRWRDLGVALFFAGLVAFPFVGQAFYVKFVANIMVLAIFAMSLNLLVGFTGLVSLGHAPFFGLAAYTVYFLSSDVAAAGLWSSLVAAIAVSAAAALVIGLLALRTAGVYFIMATLAFGQMVYYLVHDNDAVFGGSDGVFIYLRPDASILGLAPFDLESPRALYFVILAAMVGTFLLLRVLLASPFGHALVGIRTNEHRMRSLGFPTFRYKLVCFVIAGALAGLAGHLGATLQGFVNPELLSWHRSGDALMMVILGGMGTQFGPILGAFTLVVLQDLASQWTKHWQLLVGGFVILVVLALPHGLAGLAMRRAARRDE